MPYTWSAIDPLPAGITLSSEGVFSGAPIAPVPGAYYQVQATDGVSVGIANLWLEVLPKAVAAPLYTRRLEFEALFYSFAKAFSNSAIAQANTTSFTQALRPALVLGVASTAAIATAQSSGIARTLTTAIAVARAEGLGVAQSTSFALALMPSRFSSAIATFNGSADMTLLRSGQIDDSSFLLPDIGFNFTFWGTAFRSNIHVGSNSYITFGAGSSNYSSLAANNPAIPTIHIGSGDRSNTSVFYKASSGKFLIRFEGGQSSSGGGNLFWEATLFDDGAVMLVSGTNAIPSPYQSVNKGDGAAGNDVVYSLAANSSVVIRPSGNVYTVTTGSYT